MQPEPITTKSLPRWAPWAALAAITLVAALLRFLHLGDRGIPGDELELWRFCQSGVSAWGILWGEIKGVPMYTLLPAYIKGMQEWFNLPVTPFSIRLPVAILGTLCVPILFLAGRRLLGTLGGLLAATLLAIHPVHIQCSMEAYPYILGLFGFTLGLAVVLANRDAVRAGRRLAIGWYVAFALGALCMTFATIATWPFLALIGLAFAAPHLAHVRRAPKRALVPVLIAAAIVFAILAHPLWANLKYWFGRGGMAYGNAAYHADGIKLFDPDGLYFATNFGWGDTPLRLALTLLVLALAAVAVWRRRRDLGVWLVVALVVGSFLAVMGSRYFTRNPFHTRFMVPAMPAYILLLTAGVLLPFQLACAQRLGPALRRGAAGLWVLALIALLAGPAGLAARIEGSPFPYQKMTAWADQQFRPGTPVLCDRFFDAYNEFICNAPTGVVFFGTQPNEPMQRFEQIRWRDGAREFLENNPDAAFYEAKMFWNFFGPWEWPHQYFARKQPFFDQRFARLLKLGLAYREVPRDLTPEEIARTIYYNTRDDVLARARAEGRSGIVFYGDGWTPTKTQDYRDWRAMGAGASLELYHLGPAATNVLVEIEAVAAGADKQVRVAGGGVITFPGGRPVRAAMGPLPVQPGRNVIALEDARWALAQTPLLVHRVALAAEPPAQSPGAAP